ncbi:hypothetical protein MTO96_032621, partial [Rhipicephalus appendiculatus]
FVTRQAKEDFEYNGIKFKAGTNFMAALYQILTDSRYFSNPMEFNPDRYSPGNDASFTKAAHIPFGVGPRNCVGMRLALLKIRYTVARMVQKYRLELGPSQKGTMEMGQYAMVSTPARGSLDCSAQFGERTLWQLMRIIRTVNSHTLPS